MELLRPFLKSIAIGTLGLVVFRAEAQEVKPRLYLTQADVDLLRRQATSPELAAAYADLDVRTKKSMEPLPISHGSTTGKAVRAYDAQITHFLFGFPRQSFVNPDLPGRDQTGIQCGYDQRFARRVEAEQISSILFFGESHRTSLIP